MIIDEDTPSLFAARRAFDGFCPEKQKLLLELRQLLFKSKDEDRQEEIVARLLVITFVPSVPGESRTK